jgi:hypothetical protein
VQATKTFAKIKGLIQEALAKGEGIVKGAIKIIRPRVIGTLPSKFRSRSVALSALPP